MGIKKKLGLGMVSAALGLSLVGGGTYAYFSDKATIHNGFAAGTLNLDLKKAWDFPMNFDLSNIQPGESYERQFVLKNSGSLAIEDVFMGVSNVDVEDTLGTGATDDQFLDSLIVTYFVDSTAPVVDPDASDAGYLLLNSQDITLREAIAGEFAGKIKSQYLKNGKLNLTPLGLNSGSENRFRMIISFPDTGAAQNHLQGMKAKIDFNFEARQVMAPKNYDQNSPNGFNTGNGIIGDRVTKDQNQKLVNPEVTDEDAWDEN
jgi:spore coat-associated protein N